MRYLTTYYRYNESSKKEFLQELVDICLELRDDGFYVDIGEDTSEYVNEKFDNNFAIGIFIPTSQLTPTYNGANILMESIPFSRIRPVVEHVINYIESERYSYRLLYYDFNRGIYREINIKFIDESIKRCIYRIEIYKWNT